MSELIDRQAVIDKINERQRKLIYCFGFENDAVKIMDIAKSIIIAGPPAQPERAEGEWSDGYRWQRCSLCKQTGKKSWNYCPNCGARMKGERQK